MAALVKLERAVTHLRLPMTSGDHELEQKVEEASAIVLAFIDRPTDAVWTAAIAAWDDETAPAVVQAAVLLQIADMYTHRGDEGRSGTTGIGSEAELLLRATGYRDPVMA